MNRNIDNNHIKIIDKEYCTACNSCVQACPKGAIALSYDEEGFNYPYVDNSKCINCGICIKKCHMFIPKEYFEYSETSLCYGAYNKDNNILKDSSSGGIFWLLVDQVITLGGVVYGAKALPGFNVQHDRGSNLQECCIFRKSKYLQSDINDSYVKTKKDLEDDLYVLFSGTPCQIAGLKAYLGKSYSKLLTVEVICHGVPSRKAFDKWLSELEVRQGSKSTSMVWRDKRDEKWGPNKLSYQFDNGAEYISTSKDNLFQRGFLDNLYLRNSCYSCRYASLPRIADVSLADFWNYKGALYEQNNNRGLSIVIVNSELGEHFFNSIKGRIVYNEEDIELVKRCSRHIWKHPRINPFRKKFFSALEKHSFEYSAKRYLYNLSNYDRIFVKTIKFFNAKKYS